MSDLIAEEEVEESTTSEEQEEVEATDDSQIEAEAETDDIEDDETGSDEEEDEESEPESLEFDFGGKKLAVRKDAGLEEVAGELQSYAKSIEAAHTKRSQEVAETNKALEERMARVQKLEGLHGEALDTYSQGLIIQREIAQLEKMQRDEPDMWQNDPDRARQISDRKSILSSEFNNVTQKTAQYDFEIEQATQGELKKRIEEGEQAVEKIIPGFKAKAPEVIDYVTKHFNVPQKDAEMWAVNPTSAIMAYESMMYRKLTAKAKSTAKVKVVEAKPVKPMKSTGGKQVRPLNGNISPDEYERRYKAMMAKQGR